MGGYFLLSQGLLSFRIAAIKIPKAISSVNVSYTDNIGVTSFQEARLTAHGVTRFKVLPSAFYMISYRLVYVYVIIDIQITNALPSFRNGLNAEPGAAERRALRTRVVLPMGAP